MPTATAPTESEASDSSGIRRQRDVEARLVPEHEAAFGRHEGVVDDEVVASGAAQARHRPGVLDLDVGGGQHHHAYRRLAAVVHDAVGDEPVAVLAAAGERPLSGDPEPTVDRRGHARRVDRAGEDDVGAVGVQGVERRAVAASRAAPAPSVRSSPSTRPSHRPGPARRSPASRRAGRARRRRGCGAPASGSSPPPSAPPPDPAAPADRVRSPRCEPRWRAPAWHRLEGGARLTHLGGHSFLSLLDRSEAVRAARRAPGVPLGRVRRTTRI